MVNSNEQSLLTYLEEQQTTTQSSLTNEKRTLWYWRSGHLSSEDFGKLTNEQIDFFMEGCTNRIQLLKFRLEWLDTQIGNLQALISLTQPNK